MLIDDQLAEQTIFLVMTDESRGEHFAGRDFGKQARIAKPTAHLFG